MGPYYLLNDMQPTILENLVNSEGKQFPTIGIALCRCGELWYKSFCDGTHATISLSEVDRII
jgi:CDGSH-type Zn-finger protein